MKIVVYFFLLTFILSCSEDESLSGVDNKTITTSGLNFIPSTLVCQKGDTIYFDLGASHNAIEVSEDSYTNSLASPINDGFQFGFGEDGFVVFSESKTHYYVCTPHLPSMKAVIVVN